MRRLASLVPVLVLASGCALVFDGGGSSSDDDVGGGDDCRFSDPDAPSVALRNPETLGCEEWLGPWPCDDALSIPAPSIAPSIPTPSWGSCNSSCGSLAETECAESLDCRVVRDAACAISGACATDFLGCFPLQRFSEVPELDCYRARHGEECSQSAACTAFHRGVNTDTGPESRPFAMCAPEGAPLGTCHGEVVCDEPPPGCPPDRRPGVAGGCYTGACLPVDLCEPAPQQ